MVVTSYGRDNNSVDKIKKKTRDANNSLSYRFATIKHIETDGASEWSKTEFLAL